MSINRVILIGYLGKDPEVRPAHNGEVFANFSLATTEKWKDKQGERQEHIEWHRCSTFGKLAEIVSKYMEKGSLIYLEGKLRTRKWTDKSGVEKYSTEIICDKIQMLGGGSGARKERESAPVAKKEQSTQRTLEDMDDDIPF